ncbi:hypothetical protein BG74_09215 [Sodalis-like endosymbiont of Proechinophthirus fluctus]|nr:hypothetical protein BG74_09215 [Sodalis-like endosymbiont of Proechinophthirus fluctus]
MGYIPDQASTAPASVIKQFDSAVTVINLDGSRVKPANGQSLMKIIALGFKKVINYALPLKAILKAMMPNRHCRK